MTAIRPPAWPTVQPAPAGGRAAFFLAVKAEAAPTPAPASQPIRVEPRGEPQPQKVLRPGSLLDIKV